MTVDEFRKLALSLPEAIEKEHMNHPDFRVGGRIFASIGPDEEWGMVKLTPEQQQAFLGDKSGAFRPASGTWGKHGSTLVTLDKADEAVVEQALLAAWSNHAPANLVKQIGE